jgi:hypothetical protein
MQAKGEFIDVKWVSKKVNLKVSLENIIDYGEIMGNRPGRNKN